MASEGAKGEEAPPPPSDDTEGGSRPRHCRYVHEVSNKRYGKRSDQIF
jgi:hypothetical protein